MNNEIKKKFEVGYVHRFSEKTKSYRLEDCHLVVDRDTLYLMRDKGGKIEIENKHTAKGFEKFIKKQGRLKVTVGRLPNNDVLIGLAGKDGYGYVWNLDCSWCSEWGSGADLTKE